jgi:hypothetical protein
MLCSSPSRTHSRCERATYPAAVRFDSANAAPTSTSSAVKARLRACASPARACDIGDKRQHTNAGSTQSKLWYCVLQHSTLYDRAPIRNTTPTAITATARTLRLTLHPRPASRNPQGRRSCTAAAWRAAVPPTVRPTRPESKRAASNYERIASNCNYSTTSTSISCSNMIQYNSTRRCAKRKLHITSIAARRSKQTRK